MTKIKTLTNTALVGKLKLLVAAEKKNVAAQIALLKEVKQRKLALALGHPHLLSFCEHELGLTKDQAWKRSQAAGAVEKEPALFDMLSNGQTNLSALAAVAPKLTEKTAAEIKAFVPQKSKREVEAFVSTLRKDGTRSKGPQKVRRSFELTLQTEEKLKHAAKLLRQNKSDITDDEVLNAALELLIEKRDPARKAARAKAREESKVEKTQKVNECGQVPKTAPGQAKKQTGRYIPAKVRHEVYAKSAQQCEFVGANGKRCSASTGLHLDHIKPFSHGGAHEVSNLRLLCTGHNRYLGYGNTG